MVCNLLRCEFGNTYISQRKVMCVMTFLGIVCGYSMRACMNIALPEMVAPKPHKPSNGSKHEYCAGNASKPVKVTGGQYNWTEKEQQSILGIFFYGYVLTHIPGGYLSDLFGGRHVFSQCVFLTAVVTLVVPVSIDLGGATLLAATRFVVGLCQGVLFPASTTLLAKWVPRKERSFWASLVMSGTLVGSITGNYASAELISSTGSWRVVFYFWSGVTLAWYVLWLILCFSEPDTHPFITDDEKEFLAVEIGKTEKLPTPWKAFLSDNAVLAMMAGQIGHGAVFFLYVTELPKYMKDVLKFNIKESGVLNSVPYLLMWMCGNVTGAIGDWLIAKEKLSIVQLRKIYTTIASVGPSICVVSASYMGCDRNGASAMFILGMFTMGPFYPGLRINTLDITKNFGGIVNAFVNGAGALAFAPVPHLIAVFAHDATLEQWRFIFWMIFITCSVTNVIYVIWGSGERAEWDKVA